MKLAADVIDRSVPHLGSGRVAQALAADPALRSLPSDVLARRLGVSRLDAERGIGSMVHAYAGAFVAPSGRSFDETIAAAGRARRGASSPEALNEAAGFRGGAGATAIERPRGMLARNVPPGQSLAWRRAMMGAGGYQTPPIPDLACILLSDAFPCTRRNWSKGDAPTSDEVVILNWQHPLVTNGSVGSVQSRATLKAISAGARSWDQDVNVAGNSLTQRNTDERVKWWGKLQTLMTAGQPGVLTSAHTGRVIGWPVGWDSPPTPLTPVPWGLPPPLITSEHVYIYYWDLSDASTPRMKCVYWVNKALSTLSSGQSVIDATLGKVGGAWEIWVDDNGVVKWQEPEGYDWERAAMQLFAGLQNTIQGLTTAISAAVAVYCPACSVAIKIAGNLAANAAKNAVTTKALASYGDQMLADASRKAKLGDASALNALRAFAGALIGLPATAAPGAQPNGGLTFDYLAGLGTAWGNVPAALQAFAQDHSNTITSSADIARIAVVPLEDAQYAVAAMTDTLSRFASNVSAIYIPPDWTPMQKIMYEAENAYIASRFKGRLVPQQLQNLPNVSPSGQAAAGAGAATPIVVGAAAIGAAWYLGLLKGLL